MISFKTKLITIFLIGGFLLGSIFALIQASNKIMQLRSEINQLQTQLKECHTVNQDLIDQIKVQQENYVKARKELEEASKKPIKRVYIKQTIKEPVYITNNDCQQMADLINQAQEQLK
jgi:PIN domain nuclease of toxin-antitoxin system